MWIENDCSAAGYSTENSDRVEGRHAPIGVAPYHRWAPKYELEMGRDREPLIFLYPSDWSKHCVASAKQPAGAFFGNRKIYIYITLSYQQAFNQHFNQPKHVELMMFPQNSQVNRVKSGLHYTLIQVLTECKYGLLANYRCSKQLPISYRSTSMNIRYWKQSTLHIIPRSGHYKIISRW